MINTQQYIGLLYTADTVKIIKTHELHDVFNSINPDKELMEIFEYSGNCMEYKGRVKQRSHGYGNYICYDSYKWKERHDRYKYMFNEIRNGWLIIGQERYKLSDVISYGLRGNITDITLPTGDMEIPANLLDVLDYYFLNKEEPKEDNTIEVYKKKWWQF